MNTYVEDPKESCVPTPSAVLNPVLPTLLPPVLLLSIPCNVNIEKTIIAIAAGTDKLLSVPKVYPSVLLPLDSRYRTAEVMSTKSWPMPANWNRCE